LQHIYITVNLYAENILNSFWFNKKIVIPLRSYISTKVFDFKVNKL